MGNNTKTARFWDRAAAKYAKSKIKNMPAYEATLARVQSYLKPTDTVLELGCGTGSTALLLADNVAQYTASDISPNMIEIARGKAAETGLDNLKFTVAPVIDAPFAPDSFDAVLGFSILHLVDDLPGTLGWLHRVLKPGGLLISKTACLRGMNPLIRVILPAMQWVGLAPYVGVFNSDALEKSVRDAGFEIVESRVFDGAKGVRFIVARKI